MFSESCHLWSRSSPARRTAVASPQGGPECQMGARVESAKHRAGTGRALHKGQVSMSTSQSRMGGCRGHRAPGGRFLHTRGRPGPLSLPDWGSGSRPKSLGFFALLRQTREGWRWMLCLAGRDETCGDGQAVPWSVPTAPPLHLHFRCFSTWRALLPALFWQG